MTFWRYEWKALILILGGFLVTYYLPVEFLQSLAPIPGPVAESLFLVRWYAREHMLLCLVPAFFIAGGIGVFVSQGAVMRYLGAGAKKVLAYGVASVSGTILAVCSCTVLPLFAGIYQRGAGLGPATAFLYAGPAINVLAIILTARVLGMELGVARAVGAVAFSIVIGAAMHLLFRREEAERAAAQGQVPAPRAGRPLWETALLFASMIGVLVFANWGAPAEATGFWQVIFGIKWYLAGLFAVLLAVVVGLLAMASADGGELREWFSATWQFAKQILPLLLLGVLVSGLLLGRPGGEGLIPSEWVAAAVGGNSLRANFFASFGGALMYFATLTEVPIVQGLLGAGMGKGPALALLLAGPALSLPSMLVIRSILGTRKTLAFISLTVVMATVTGLAFGALEPTPG